MSLFESLEFSNDQNIFILDIGSVYTKCGIAGENGPRCIIPSIVKHADTGKVSKLWEYNTIGELYHNLKEHLFTLLFRHLLMCPKDKRVVVVESLLCPTDFRECLARVLFRHFEVATVLFAPGHALSLLTLGTSCGLVLDVGYIEALVVPVYEGVPLIKALQSIPVGGKSIHNRIKSLVLSNGVVKGGFNDSRPVSEMPDCLSEDVLEDIKVRLCFVTEFSRSQAAHRALSSGSNVCEMPVPPPSVEYPLDGASVLTVSGEVREYSCEVLFELDIDRQSIATIILDSLLKCPIDTRRQLAKSIVVIGGTAMTPGFYHRLKHELESIASGSCYKERLPISTFNFLIPPSEENCTSWLGGAMIGALDTLPAKSLSRDTFLQQGHLPDWCFLDMQTWIIKQDALLCH